MMKIVNASVESALENLGYPENERREILSWISEHGTAEGAPHIKNEHLAVFDCAVRPEKGMRSISWKGHVKMVGAVQPFISGAISKTFNMSHETTKEEIVDAYMMAWKLGIKAFAVYRDGSKATQPLNTSANAKSKIGKGAREESVYRHRLPSTRISETHKFSIAGHEGYLTYSMYEDGTLGEVFVRMSKQGSTLSGLLDVFAISVSLALQYGVPLKELAHKFIYTRFEPAGFTENPSIHVATSIVDYIFKYLVFRFLGPEELSEFGMTPLLNSQENGIGEVQGTISDETREVTMKVTSAVTKNAVINEESVSIKTHASGKTVVSTDIACRKCGGIMVRTGTCSTCLQCGDSSGGCS
jgi:ribonucleoside-diphosphate reductase alpha chain